ncbi:hypothetical protein I6B53_01530 [Schaalia sp. 19OD2882]|nr:hypothetical protein I6B53_01530 [Schaalia sp. 19OD2882]
MRAKVALAATGLLVAILAFLALRAHLDERAYREGLRLEQTGERESALRIFTELGDHADSAQRARSLVAADPALPFKGATKGEIVDFGSFEQDGDTTNGVEPIRWIVLDRIEGRLLLLSLDCLDARAHHRTPFEPVTWETSDVRAWMNTEFLRSAFTEAERGLIPLVEVDNANQSKTGTAGGHTTMDHVFALSETEASIYIANAVEQDLIGAAAASFAVRSTLPGDQDGHVDWWLRSPGTYDFAFQYVDRQGQPLVSGGNADLVHGIRPALWLDTTAGAAK